MDDELCRICIGSHASGSPMKMISIFGEDSLWQKITTIADVQITKNDTLPQQVCVDCAKTAISAYLFKKKCEDADRFYRQQLLLKKIHGVEKRETGRETRKDAASGDRAKSRGCSTASSSGTASGTASGSTTGSGSSSSSTSSDDDEEEDNDNANANANPSPNPNGNDNDNGSVAGDAGSRLQNGHGDAISGHLVEDPIDEDEEHGEQQLDLDDGQRSLFDDEQQDQSGIELSNGVALADGEEDLEVMTHEESPDHADDGEIPVHDGHSKEPFDFNSIRLMQEYMQHQMNKFPNGGAGLPGHDLDLDHQLEVNEDDDDEEMTLPLIPEIELITPGDDSMIGPDGADHSEAIVAANEAGQVMRVQGFQCPHCYQTFDMKQILKAHMQSVHGAPGPVYECSNCRKTYFYKRFLEKHIRRGRCVKKRRNQTRPMQCSDCHVLFPTGHHLGWHKRTGCPSKAAKMPLQQLFKQNIVQFNNFPKRVPASGGGAGAGAGAARKPTAPDLHVNNRKLGLVNKRKGRTRIKLDAKKIALAKQLILREATTTVIANELNISRTFAWRLRKSLVNGVSLHERVVDQAAEEQLHQQQQHIQALQQHQQQEQAAVAAAAATAVAAEREREHQHQHLSLPFGHLGLGLIKEERQDSEDEEQQQLHLQHQHQLHSSLALGDECGADEIGAEETAGYMGDEDAVCSLLHNGYDMRGQLEDPDPDSDPVEHDPYEANENERHPNAGEANSVSPPPPPLAPAPVQVPVHVPSRPTVEVYKRLLAESQHFPHIVNTQQLQLHQQQQHREQLQHQQKPAHNGGMPMLTRYPPAVIHALPVNLSLRSMAHMNSNESNGSNSSNNTVAVPAPHPGASATPASAAGSGSAKKPRKPNVFIDDEKYAMAKLLVAQNSSTMEIARALNVSQMTAWKVRDAILKGVPLSYRNKRTEGRHSALGDDARQTDVASAKEQHAQQLVQEQELQQVHQHQQALQQAEQERQERQKGLQQEMQRQQQQQLEQMERIKQQRQRQEQIRQQQQQQQQQLRHQTPADTSHFQQQPPQQPPQQPQQQQPQLPPLKLPLPRRRLKAAERELRDKNITREILELIEEDSNIQYWKVSARLAEKGINISPSSVCQKLKSMGIHRRWKPGDKPSMLAISQIKAATVAAALAVGGVGMGVGASSGVSSSHSFVGVDDGYEQQQFDMGGPHFLSAFTR
ncbi:uncharacterized protein LOC108151114 [Drosophila miranda]|uniref:uncharacterized protein LOC108151114 n=1 Tax=Drosophila miranda TaxID=7229 RepID=UPI0007E7B823|nr:uncharacterized protein LOC108151114 [Drosophila miranda]XP_017135023.1 uncharacterized protein LOC108151114 [Drosophila miranda]XP_033250201.1 uncharacterized protein LOC108151114 [Drosophila miranda]